MVGTLLTTSLNDYGWTSPWRFSGEEGAGHAFRLQHIVSSTGDGALEMAAPGALERDFPPIERGILRIELRVQLEKAGIDIADAETSVLKVYAGDADDNWAFRWHYPFAWPEVGGNVFPRFYVIDGRGRVAYRANWADARELQRVLERQREIGRRRSAGEHLGIVRWSEEINPALADDPDQEFTIAINVWEQAENYGEPERFLGPERAEQYRAGYERATGRRSIRPPDSLDGRA